MYTAKFGGSALAVLLIVLARCAPTYAHPVAQGAMEIDATDHSLRIRATVSAEEVLVAASAHADGADNAWSAYAEYLRNHLHVRVDDKSVAGRVVSAARAAPRPTYLLEYALPDSSGHIRITQDSLHEIEYAPGNNWEAAYLVTLRRADEAPAVQHLLTLTQPLEFRIGTPASSDASSAEARTLAFSFFLHGVRHILSGFDHLLFIGALVLGAAGLWDLVKVISAFTLAHTLTLTLATLDIFRLPPSVVEPAIAASIVVVALQSLRDLGGSGYGPRALTAWTRAAVAFVFGLFHGLGFAGGLLDAAAGMPGKQLATALASFSLGVEAGQQLIVIPVFVALAFVRRSRARVGHAAELMQPAGAVAISLGGLAYFIAALRY